MLKALKFLNRAEPVAATVPDGLRLYAIGDVHGRADLLRELLAAIDHDDRTRGDADTQVIFLGDLIDRGPDSAEVIDIAIDMRDRQPSTRFLMGNHEEVFLRVLNGDVDTLGFFLNIGGRETLMSYGIDGEMIDGATDDDLLDAMVRHVPASHRDFLADFADMVLAGDYAFVHAGMRPGVEHEAQTPSDLHWIREPFLRHRGSFGAIVVHGHTIAEEIDERPNRIGIDTGAFYTGKLTAIGLEAGERWYLST